MALKTTFQDIAKTALTCSCALAFLLADAAMAGQGKRAKVIDFDDEVVEGLNKRPLDSLSQISERNKKKKKPHLYRKRAGFRSENAETLRVARFTP